jgi:RES domain-containing protein
MPGLVSAFRIVKKSRADTAMDGEGARRTGGRWNSPGTRMVYAASSLSLATLEVMVHLDDYQLLRSLYCSFRLEFPETIVDRLGEDQWPADWSAAVARESTRRIGNAWIRSGAGAILAVPSVVTPGEWNYLLNPVHPGIAQVTVAAPVPFQLDDRISR